MLKIGYFGDGPWASRALAYIAERRDRFEVAFIVPRHDLRDPVLKEWAEKLNVPFLPCPDVNDEKFVQQVSTFGCDLLVSMSFNQILKSPILNAAPLGFLNCHAGSLPFYRGRNPLNWVLINGEKKFGVTVHYIDEGIDTGDILFQKEVKISPQDDYGSLLEKAHEACAKALVEALFLVDKKREKARSAAKKQDALHSVGFYCGRRRSGDEWIDWHRSSQEIYNFIRALSPPGPGARSISEKGEIALLKAELIANAPVYRATHGEIVGRTVQGVVVKTGDSTLLITQAAFIDKNNIPSEGFVPQWSIGTRLGLSPLSELHRLHKAVQGFEKELSGLRREIENLKQAQTSAPVVKEKG